MKKPTKKDLFEFVYRADTLSKICTAERWLSAHKHLTCRATFDELIAILNRTAKRLFQEQLAEREKRLYAQNFEINVITGEVITQ